MRAPPQRVREAIAAVMAVEMLTEGAYFESGDIWRLPFSKKSVLRTFRHLIDLGVIQKSSVRGKYHLTEEFTEAMKRDITRNMPRGTFVHYPDLGVFDICGIESWTDAEFGAYVGRLRERWLLRTRQAGKADAGGGLQRGVPRPRFPHKAPS